MRQTSEAFMNELLKDNSPPSGVPDLSKQIAETIDKKMAQAFKKYEEEISKIVQSKQEEPEAPEEPEASNEDNNLGGTEDEEGDSKDE